MVSIGLKQEEISMIDKAKKEECQKCGECCESVGIWYQELTPDAMKWHIYHGAKIIYAEESNIWGVEYMNKCVHLTSNKTCAIFDSRPEICRQRGKVPDDLRGCTGIKRFNTLEEVNLCVGQQ